MKYEATKYIAMQVNHYKEAIDFYKNVMNMELKKINKDETEFKSGDLTLFIEDNPKNQVFLEFRVEDIETAKKDLISAGCKIIQEYGNKSILIEDPYGINFHLYQD